MKTANVGCVEQAGQENYTRGLKALAEEYVIRHWSLGQTTDWHIIWFFNLRLTDWLDGDCPRKSFRQRPTPFLRLPSIPLSLVNSVAVRCLSRAHKNSSHLTSRHMKSEVTVTVNIRQLIFSWSFWFDLSHHVWRLDNEEQKGEPAWRNPFFWCP